MLTILSKRSGPGNIDEYCDRHKCGYFGDFFGGFPRRVLEAVVEKKITAFATVEIVDEYNEIVEEMIRRKQGNLSPGVLSSFVRSLHMITTTSEFSLSRDPDDDTFIACAVDLKSLYIVSGDQDLLVLKHVGNVEIITAADFCRQYLCG